MKFENFINEKSLDWAPLDWATHINRDCKKFMNEIKCKSFLWRGISLPDEGGIKNTQKSRTAKGMLDSDDMSEAFNDFLQKNGHIRRDKNVLIATGNRNDAIGFGTPCIVFPIGNYKYSYLQTGDFNIQYSYENDSQFRAIKTLAERLVDIPRGYLDKKNAHYDRFWEMPLEKLKKMVSKLFISNKNLLKALDRGYEVWFNVRKYYYISNKGIIEELIGKNGLLR
jgi:hypothetical protein